MRKIIYTASCVLLLLLAPARAQQQQPMTGTYLTYIGGRLVVTESYRVTTQQDGSIVAEGEITPAAGGAKQKVVASASKTKPDSFFVEVGGVKALEAKFVDGGVVKLNAAGQPEREVRTKATMVLENLVWHQFVFLLGQYDHARGGRQNFTAFLPSQGIEYPVTLEDAPAQTYTLPKDRTTFATRRYKVVAAGALTLDMWTDEARVPLLFQVESQQIKVVRQGFENLAEVAFAAPAAYKSPAYVVPAAFTVQELMIGAGGEWPLPATLTLPTGKAPFPAIVLVHGSGPNDRDETQGANKPFRDLAEGLASQGIAVLRYEKRTKQHGARIGAVALSSFTVKDETIDDALAAVALLRRTKGVDAEKIFVLGHSLGGMLVPRIGVADTRVAGFIVFAGATRPLEEMMVRQFEYLAALDGTISDAERAQIDDTKRQAARIRELKAGDAAAVERLLGAPPGYWLDLRGYDPPQAAGALKRPMLILQGERDFNVTMDDFRNWRTALANRKEIEFKSYPKLDHLFYEGEGAASGADYAQPRNIPKYVIDDIAAWVKKQG
jgi:dienelactone hydrolase